MVTEATWDSWTAAGLRPYADTVIEAFGPDRVMFGSDWPVCRLAASYAEVLDTARTLTADLAPAERDEVFSGTATRVYGLRGPGA
jgi:L-fuconolactonase